MSNQLICLSAADIHGNIVQYEKIKRLVVEKNISYVFLCGDILPKTGGSWSLDNKIRTIKMQADFIDDYFLDYLTQLGKATKVYAIFGNDDFKSNYPKLAQAQIPNVKFLNNEVVEMSGPGKGYLVAGYPYVGLTPFLHKDWEKWDLKPGNLPHKIYQTSGYSSKNGEHFPVDFVNDEKLKKTSIKNDLENLAKMSDPRKTIYMFHEAPYNTPLDMIAADNKYIKGKELHIGSMAIREFVDSMNPLITMHGHIHETFYESGGYQFRSGSSISVTASNDFAKDILAYVLFRLPEPIITERCYD